MKISSIQLVLASIGFNAHIAPVNAINDAGEMLWEPPRLNYRDLLQTAQSGNHANIENKIHDALFTGVGVLSLTNVIGEDEKERLYDAMGDCHASADSAKEVVYLDGTKRSTWAASSSADLMTCEILNEASRSIRKKVGEVTINLALQIEATLTRTLGRSVTFPKTSGDGEYYLHELVGQGEQLDHFHVYSSKATASETGEAIPKTIDWHTDYGFALAFMPGQVPVEGISSSKYTPSKGFFIQLPDGSAKEVKFTDEDDVVILLGDGVAHINNAIGNNSVNLRSVPHSFIMSHHKDINRMWFGRMLLFPTDMTHSNLNQSFGDVKEAMNSDPSYHISNDNRRGGYALGCSSPEVLAPRLLADEMMTCEEDQFMCWHACFNHTEEVSPTACESRELELACVSSVDGSIWDGETHSKEFGPACILADDATPEDGTNSTSTATDEDIASIMDGLDNPTLAPNSDEAHSSSTATKSPTSSSTMSGLYHFIYVAPLIALAFDY